MTAAATPHWLDLYGNTAHYAWRSSSQNGATIFYRPLGLVELAFDADGRYYEGRADMNVRLDLAIKSKLPKAALHDRIRLAWTTLGCKNPLIRSRAVKKQSYMAAAAGVDDDMFFTIDLPQDAQDALRRTEEHVVFLEDHFSDVDAFDFYLHAQNTARVVDPDKCLLKLFVSPSVEDSGREQVLRFSLIGSHEIQDGISNHIWLVEFVELLNKSIVELNAMIEEAIEPSTWHASLPLPQEALYPPISGSRAKQRWFWLLTRIVRHVRAPHPAGFPNPLRRKTRLDSIVTLSPVYSPALDYSRPPVTNTYLCVAETSAIATRRLHSICRVEPAVSIGAGCFALAALLMMEFHERLDPDVPLAERKPFITGFPLNPRPFLSRPVSPNSLMLAFSDGIALPFLPSHLPLAGRLRLLARQAQRQLAIYQKRPGQTPPPLTPQSMSSRGAGRVLAIQYLSSLERANAILPKEHRRPGPGPQDAYPMRANATAQTCGVSSVGHRAKLSGTYSLDLEAGEGKDFAADFRLSNSGVRAREEEFLVGVGGSDDGLWANVSVDVTSIDPGLVGEWKARFEKVLEDENVARL